MKLVHISALRLMAYDGGTTMFRMMKLSVLFSIVVLSANGVSADPFTFSRLASTGDVIGGKTLTSVANPSLNNNGDVAFLAGFSGGAGIFTQNALLAATGDVIGGKTLSNFLGFTPSLNNNGDAAFVGTFSGGRGIFTQNALLVATGDVIGGKTLSGFGVPTLNDNGDVAFFGFFDDGSSSIVLAQQTAVIPEPSSLVLFALGTVGLVIMERRRRRKLSGR